MIALKELIYEILATIFGSSESTGAAQPFVEMAGSDDPDAPNCYAYAVGAPTNKQPGDTGNRAVTDWSDVLDVAKSVKADLNAEGYTVRILDGSDGKILENGFEEHIKTVLNKDAIKGVNVKLYKDLDKYLSRMEQMQSLENEKNREEDIMKTLYAVSL